MAATVLREMASQGYPVTGQRRTLVGLIVSRSQRFTADDLLRDLQGEGRSIGRATVFRTLELLARLGYVDRVPGDEHQAYTACDSGQHLHHHHLTCSNCGEVLHLLDCPAATLLSRLESQTGYRIETHRLEVVGVCPACQSRPRQKGADE